MHLCSIQYDTVN